MNFRFLKDDFLFLITFLSLPFAHAEFFLFFLKSCLKMSVLCCTSNMRLQNYSQISSKDFTYLAAPFSFFLSSFLTCMLFRYCMTVQDFSGLGIHTKLLRQSVLCLLWQSGSSTVALWYFPMEWLKIRIIISPREFLEWLGLRIISCPGIIDCF